MGRRGRFASGLQVLGVDEEGVPEALEDVIDEPGATIQETAEKHEPAPLPSTTSTCGTLTRTVSLACAARQPRLPPVTSAVVGHALKQYDLPAEAGANG